MFDNDDAWELDALDEGLIERVAAALTTEAIHYFDLAECLDAEPWETLHACRRLVRSRRADETPKSSGRFLVI